MIVSTVFDRRGRIILSLKAKFIQLSLKGFVRRESMMIEILEHQTLRKFSGLVYLKGRAGG